MPRRFGGIEMRLRSIQIGVEVKEDIQFYQYNFLAGIFSALWHIVDEIPTTSIIIYTYVAMCIIALLRNKTIEKVLGCVLIDRL